MRIGRVVSVISTVRLRIRIAGTIAIIGIGGRGRDGNFLEKRENGWVKQDVGEVEEHVERRCIS